MPITLLKNNEGYLLLNFEPNSTYRGKVICQVPFSNDIVYESVVRLISSKYPLKSKSENVAVFEELDEHNATLKIMDYLSSSITPKPQHLSSSEDNGEYLDNYYTSDDCTVPLYKSKLKTGIIKDISSTENGDLFILVEHNGKKQDWFGVFKDDGEIYDALSELVDVEDVKIQKIAGEYEIVDEFCKTVC